MTVDDVVAQCDAKDSGVYPYGLPASYSWYKGNQEHMDGGKSAPAGWSACTGYFVCYPQDFTNKPFVAANVFIKDLETYLHKRTGGWIKVQDGSMQINCGRFTAPQTGNVASALQVTKQADGSYMIEAPPLGYCDHGWPANRGGFTADTVDGMITFVKMRVDNPNANYLGMSGFDWWASPSAPYPQNAGSGCSSWMKLSTDWKQLVCTQMTAASLRADLPPPLTTVVTPPVIIPPVIVPPVIVPPAPQLTISFNGVALKAGDLLTIKQN